MALLHDDYCRKTNTNDLFASAWLSRPLSRNMVRDVDLQSGWWTIPASDTKNGEPHRVPLVADAIEIIQAQELDEKKRGVYVFTGNGEATVTHRAKKAPAELARSLNIDFHGHDLRRTAAVSFPDRLTLEGRLLRVRSGHAEVEVQ